MKKLFLITVFLVVLGLLLAQNVNSVPQIESEQTITSTSRNLFNTRVREKTADNEQRTFQVLESRTTMRQNALPLPYFEDFEDGYGNAEEALESIGWTGHLGYWSDIWELEDDDQVLWINLYDNPTHLHQWGITPLLGPVTTGAVEIEFDFMFIDWDIELYTLSGNDRVIVSISTTDTQVSSFSQVGIINASNYTPVLAYTTFSATANVPTGSNIYVKLDFYFGSLDIDDDYFVIIDNVSVTAVEGSDDYLQIGEGTEIYYSPAMVVFDYSYSQLIYLQSEINISGNEINKIAFHWNGGLVSPRNKMFEIYMGHTTVDHFPETWPVYTNTILPIAGLMKVFDGTVNLPAQAAWIEIDLDIPFLYNNVQNLAITINQTMPGNLSGSDIPLAGKFFATPTPEGNNRAEVRYRPDDRIYFESIEDEAHNWYWLDPIFRDAATPNIRLYFEPASTNPRFTITPTEKNFGTEGAGDTSLPTTFTIRNMGLGNLTIQSIAITGADASHFNIPVMPVLTNPLAYLGSISFDVVFSPTSVGEKNAFLTISDSFNATPHNIPLSGNCIMSYTHQIGTGTTMENPLPVHANWDHSYSQFIYLQSEIDVEGGIIDRLSFYYNGHAGWNVINFWEIYLAHTDRVDFPSNSNAAWIAAADFTKVFEGVIPITANVGWFSITLDTPFPYNNTDNLAIAVNRIGNDGAWVNGPQFQVSTLAPANRNLTVAGDGPVPFVHGNIVFQPSPIYNAGYNRYSYMPNIRIRFENVEADIILPLPFAENFDNGSGNGQAALDSIGWTGYITPNTPNPFPPPPMIMGSGIGPYDNWGNPDDRSLNLVTSPDTHQWVITPKLGPVTSGEIDILFDLNVFSMWGTPFMDGDRIEVSLSTTDTADESFVSILLMTNPIIDTEYNFELIAITGYEVPEGSSVHVRIDVVRGSNNTNGFTARFNNFEVKESDPGDPGSQIVTIGNGTVVAVGTAVQTYLPVMPYYYGDTFSQQIYYKDEFGITAAKLISQLDFHYNGNNFAHTEHRFWDIYLGHTTKTAFDATNDWISLTDHILVFSGEVPPYPTPADWMEIVFQEPFIYNNVDNLVVTVHRKRPAPHAQWNSGAGHYMTLTPGLNRGLGFGHDGGALAIPLTQNGTLVAGHNNVRLYLSSAEFGQITGVVTSNGEPLEGVLLTVEGTNRSGISDADGNYEILFVPPGVHTLTASLIGYNDWEGTVEVIVDEITIQDIEMVMLPRVIVSGRVLTAVGNQPPDYALALLTGVVDYPFVSINPEGYFTIPNVIPNGTYTLTVSSANYVPYENNAVVVGSTDLTIPDILLAEFAYPPRNVVAEALTPSVAYVSWEAPDVQDPTSPWFSHNTSAIVGGGLGSTSPHTFEMGHRYTQSQLLSMGVLGQTLTQISFVVSSFSGSDPATVTNSVQLRVYTGGSGSPFNTGTLIHSQDVPLSNINMTYVAQSNIAIWNDIELDTPITIPSTEELWITVFMNVQTGYSAATSPEGTGINNFGNIYSFNETAWQTTATSGWQRNFLIRAQANTSSGRSITISPIIYTMEEWLGNSELAAPAEPRKGDEADFIQPVAIDVPTNNRSLLDEQGLSSSRAFESYNIYRALESQLGNESLWTTIALNYTSRNIYDNSWDAAQEKVNYRYIVKSVFTDDNLSPGVPSNAIKKFPGESVYIGNPASTTGSMDFPFQYYYYTGVAQSIYLPEEINRDGLITDLTYEFQGTGLVPDNILHRVWLATVDKAVFDSTTDWLPFEHFTLVFEGTLPVNVSGLADITVTLDTPYAYDGTGSLVVMTHRNNPPASYWTNNMWRNSPAGSNRTLWVRRDGANYDPADLPAGVLNSNIPNVSINFTPPEPIQTIEIGTGTTLVTPPVEQYYNNSYSQTIYYASEIGASNQITKIYYHWNGANTGLNWRNWEVYMGHTDRTNFPSTAATNWIPTTSLSLVYAGMVTETAGAGWIEIQLTTPFSYDNNYNLVIAVHKQGSWSGTGSAGMFFGTPTAGNNRSMIARSDTNPSPYIAGIINNTLPAAWTTPASHPNIRIQLEFESLDPVFTINPTQKDFGYVAIHDVSTQDFVVKNLGYDGLVISSIEIIGANAEDFVIRNAADVVTPKVVGFGEELTLSVSFKPLTEGVKRAFLVLTDLESGRAINTIPLSGQSTDATITEFPHIEGFDDSLELPLGWGSFAGGLPITPTLPPLVDILSTVPYSPPNFLRLLVNGNDPDSYALTYTPIIENINDTYVSFRARTNANVNDVAILVGTLSDVEDHNSFVELDRFYLTNTYQQFFFSMEEAEANRLVFKHGHGGTQLIPIFMDDVEIHQKSTEPVFHVSHENLHFGNVSVFTDSAPQTLKIRNVGADGLYLSQILIVDPYEDYLIYDAEMSLTDITLDFMETYDMEFIFHPKHAGELSANIFFFGQDDIILGMSTLTVTAEDAVLSITPSTAQNFGTITIPAVSTPRNFSISNTGTGTLVINSIDIIGEDNTHFAINLPFENLRSADGRSMTQIDQSIRLEMTNGESRSISNGRQEFERAENGFPIYLENTDEPFVFTIQFTPHSGGLKNATLNLSYGDMREFNLALSGTAIDNRIQEFPFIHQFTTTTPWPPAGGWTRHSGQLPATGNAVLGANNTGNWFASTAYANTTGHPNGNAAYIEVWSSQHGWLITPEFNLDATPGEKVLNFDVALTNYNNNGTPAEGQRNARFIVLVSGNNQWSVDNILAEWAENAAVGAQRYYNRIPNYGESISLDLSAYSGTIRVAFFAVPLTGSDNYLHLDNVVIREKEEISIAEYPWYEGFEGALFPPRGWTSFTNNPLGFNWNRGFIANTGGFNAASESFRNGFGAITPDNWLITPKLSLPEASSDLISLSYVVAGLDPTYFEENYSLLISTTDTSPASFTALLTETLSSSAYTLKTIDLNDYAGQDIYLAFRHHTSPDWFMLRIDDVSITVAPYLPPPQNLAATTGFGLVDLTWEAPADLTPLGYKVYRGGTAITDVITEMTYRDRDLLHTMQFTYHVTAIFLEGESVPSNMVTVTPVGEYYHPPVEFEATLVGTTATLTWEAPEMGWFTHTQDDSTVGGVGLGADAAADLLAAQRFSVEQLNAMGLAGKDLTRLAIMVGQANATYTLMVWTGGSLVGTTFTPGTVVHQQPLGTNLAINTWLDYELTTPVLIPSNQEMWIGYRAVTTGGYPLVRDNGPEITNFGALIQWGTNAWTNLGNVGIPGYNWCIKGFAETASGTIALERSSTHIDVPPPTYSRETSNITIAESSPHTFAGRNSHIFERSYSGFNVYRNKVLMTPTPITATTYTDTNLTVDAYLYEVTVLYTLGESDPVSILLKLGLNAPTGLTATAGSGKADLSWVAPVSPGISINGYRIYRNGEPVSDIVTGTAFTATGLTNDVTYSFDVRAVYATTIPNQESDPSNVVSVTPTGEVLLQPRNLSISQNFSEIRLNWSEPGINEGWFNHNDEVYVGGLGGTGTTTFMSIAHRYTPAMLLDMGVVGGVISQVGFRTNDPAAIWTVVIWTGGTITPINPGTEIHRQLLGSNTTGGWRDYTLNTPVPITSTDELWIGFEITHVGGTFPVCRDGGPGLVGFGDLITIQGYAWGTVGQYYNISTPNGSANTFIRAFATTPSGSAITLGPIDPDRYIIDSPELITLNNGRNSFAIAQHEDDTSDRGNERAFEHYNIYLNNNFVSSTESLNYTVEVMNAGQYTFGVTAVYTDGGESPPAILSQNITDIDLVIEDYPFVDSFETAIQSGWRNRNQGWERIVNVQQANTGAAFMQSTSAGATTDHWLISPKLAIPEGSAIQGYMLSYYVASSSNQSYSIMVSTTGVAPTDFTIEEIKTINSDEWTQGLFDLTAFEGEEIYIAIRHYNNTNTGFLRLDDFKIESDFIAPVCVVTPSEHDFGLVGIGLTATQTFVISNQSHIPLVIESIEIVGPDSDYFSIVYPTGIIIVLPIVISDNPEVILTFDVAFTPLTLGIKTAEIVITDESGIEYRVPLSGQSVDDTIITPFVENFSLPAPIHWTRFTGALNSTLTPFTGTWTDNAAWHLGTFANNPTHQNGQSARVNLLGNNVHNWLVSPNIVMDVSGITLPDFFYLAFDLAFTSRTGSAQPNGIDDKFIVLISDDNGVNWTQMAVWDNQGSDRVLNDVPRNGERVNIAMTSYHTGHLNEMNFKLAFYAESTILNTDNIIHLDNVSIDSALGVNPITNLEVTDVDESYVRLAWTAPILTLEGIRPYYQVSRNGILIGEVTTLYYEDNEAPTDAYLMYSVVVAYRNPVLYSTAVELEEQVFVPRFTPVTNLIATISNEIDVTLTWTAPAPQNIGTTIGYRVYRDDVLLNTTLLTPTTLTYSDLGLTIDTKYKYDVKAVYDFFEDTEKESQPATLEVILPQYNPPMDLIARVGNAVAEVRWSAPEPQNYGEVVGYKVFRNGAMVFETTALLYLNTGLTNDVTYTYYVVAVWGGDIDGESLPSETITVTPGASAIPQNLELTVVDSINVLVSWTFPLNSRGGEERGEMRNRTSRSTTFMIYRDDVLIGESSTLQYLDEGLELDTMYEYDVVAVLSPSITSFPVSDSIIVPMFGPILDLVALREGASNRLNWTSPTEQNYGTLTGIEVLRGTQVLQLLPPTATTYLDQNMPVDAVYEYNVRTYWGGDISGQSILVTATLLVPVYNPPLELTAESGHDAFVPLTWLPPVAQNHGEVEGYKVYRDAVEIAELPATALDYLDEGLNNAVNYTYYVVAMYTFLDFPDFDGNSEPSNIVTARPEDNILMPGSLTATLDGLHVVLNWTPPAETLATRQTERGRESNEEGGRAHLGYHVYRDGIRLTVTPLDALTFRDINTQIDVQYTYGVTAMYDSGESDPREVTIAVHYYAPVTNLVATYNHDTGFVNMTWLAPQDLELTPIHQFIIRRDGNPTPIGTTPTGTNTFTDQNVVIDTQYYYTVQVLYVGQGESYTSDEVQSNNVIVPKFTPLTVLNININNNGEIVLSWTLPATQTYGTVRGYRIIRNNDTIGIALAPNLTFLDGDVHIDMYYEYQAVVQYNDPDGQLWGESTAVANDIFLPRTNPVSNVVASYVNETGLVNITWTAPQSQNYGVITQILIYRNDVTEPIGAAAGTINSFLDGNVTPDSEYIYSVQVEYTFGELSEDLLSIAVYSNPVVVPRFTPITNLQGHINNDGRVVLTWTAPEPQEHGLITSYRVTRDGAVIGTSSVGIHTYTDVEIPVDRIYEYGVSALYSNPVGVSIEVKTSVHVPKFTPPTQLNGTAGDAVITLTWVAPEAQNHGVLLGYKIYKNTAAMPNIIPFNTTTYTDTDVENYTEYTYYIVALYADPEGVSTPTNIVTLRPVENMLPPTQLTYNILGGNNVVLNWVGPDNNYRGFRVTRNGDDISGIITDPMYIDEKVPNGTHTYHVTTVYWGGDSPAAAVTVEVYVSVDDPVDPPVANELLGNYPNPFNPDTTIDYNVATAGNVVIEVYNIRGQKIRTLVDSYKDAGEHSVSWNGRDDSGHEVSSGMYLYIMRMEGFSQMRRMTLLK